ncbi:hypothetical protein F503_06085 [Ophiostoma piceae UAMH 11346]|uniref:F-box domain-containing protein n=1 Tax=Ophiostoma piceae (strain UAMH 11346) TaxID=1262450 RepID=S3DBN6_OPHP1|nr:hypothetical protein F503_06085 [Ophiostoma piceae UAMH 11346]
MAGTLPLDIWWLVCEELTAGLDFDGLYNFARTCRTMANFALPSLYSIHELASASAEDASIIGKQKLATLWRAIILSSVGETAFPYCLWIQNLKLGDLKELLTDIAPNAGLRASFFHGCMAPYEMVLQLDPAATGSGKTTTHNRSTRRNRPRLDLQGISNKVGEDVTLFVKESAERDNRAVALTHLEGQYIPMDVLPAWTSRLATLMSLHIQDGSVIGEQVAVSIRDNCPKFRELTCFYCDGPSVDEDLASFFRTVRPNSLEVFSVSSKNRLGREALGALSLHASSLKKLVLSDLQGIAFEHVGALRPCTALAQLELEAERTAVVDWLHDYPESFADTVVWLGDCKELTDLKLRNVPGASRLLERVFKSANVQLKALDLTLIDADEEDDAKINFYKSLGKQEKLETFILRSDDVMLDYASVEHTQLINSMSKWRDLKVLDVMQTNLLEGDLEVLAASLENLEEISFDGDLMGDSVLESLLKMRKLKTVNITAGTVFTVEGLLAFINQLGVMSKTRVAARPLESALASSSHSGVNLVIMNQLLQAQISASEVQFLSEHAQSTRVGKIEIAHPEEEHESDFSD